MADREEVKAHARRLYAKLENPWPSHNRWSTHTNRTIATLLAEACSFGELSPHTKILNVGSHGNSYGIVQGEHFHADIVLEPIAGLPMSCVADAERLPFIGQCFDLVICVGSVINYCSAAAAISELGRVTKPGGLILLEFESSNSFEFLLTKDFAKDVTLVSTFYNGTKERIYVYSRKYIEAALRANDFSLIASTPFHLVTPLAYRLIRHEHAAASFGGLDRLARGIPFLRQLSANLFVVAKKLEQ